MKTQKADDMKQEIENNSRFWWFSCHPANGSPIAVFVATDSDNVITDTAPITKQFIGQPIKNMADWMRGLGGFEWEELDLDGLEAKTAEQQPQQPQLQQEAITA